MTGRRGDGETGRVSDGEKVRMRCGVAARRTCLAAGDFNLPVSPSPRLPVAERGGALWL